ncbi:MAG TPA: GNAT family N-acetyltransferase [Alphaproteobacteria bacterium]|nr:GNAT family N-acetyltransferase [Alphaproteobacteria bacterium]
MDVSLEICGPGEAEARQVMAWRNDPATLAASFHPEPKRWPDFLAEFRGGYFGQPDLPPLFVLAEGGRAGLVRFRPAAHPAGLRGRCVDVSIMLAPERRGRGLAAPALRAALAFAAGQGVDSVLAEIRPGNAASLRAFAAAGFADHGEAEHLVADTGERCRVRRLTAELTPGFWRRGGVFVIAEAGSNWRMGTPARDRAMGRALIDAAAEAGADAVKFQTYRPETVYVANAGRSDYLSDAGITEDISAIFADLAMPYELVGELAEHAARRGIAFMSTAFSPEDFAAVDPHVAVHKIASYEISHPHLIALAARSGKPTIISTGAAAEADIAWAVGAYRAAGGRDLCLLQCTARYPAPMEALNLAAIPWLQRRFGAAAGLSDHSREPLAGPVAAAALGARVIEKHYTLDNRLPGPDHAFAVTAEELAAMVRAVRQAEAARGTGVKEVLPAERELAAYARRGLQATRDVAAGEILREGVNFAVLRPGRQPLGAHPRDLARYEGRPAARAVPLGRGLSPDDLAE